MFKDYYINQIKNLEAKLQEELAKEEPNKTVVKTLQREIFTYKSQVIHS